MLSAFPFDESSPFTVYPLASWITSRQPNASSTLPRWTPCSDVSSFMQAGPGSSPWIYSNLSPLDPMVMDLMGTSAAAVPAATTSEKVGNSL